MMRVSELLRKLQGAHPEARVVIALHQDHDNRGEIGDVSSVYIDEDGVPELVVKFGEVIPKASYTELPEELHNSDEEHDGAWCDECGIHHSGSCDDDIWDDGDEEVLGHLPEDDGIPVQRRIAVREDN